VRAEVAERAGARPPAIQSPDARRGGIDEPFLEVHAAEVPDRPEPSSVDQLPGQRDRRHAPVVVAEHVRHARLAYGGEHPLRVADGIGERLFAEDRLARARGGNRYLGMAVAGRADVDHVDIRPADDLAPVSGGLFPAKSRGRIVEPGAGPPAQDLEARLETRAEESGNLAPRVRMGPAHERVANHGDVNV
jgi:hypothetical protein